MLQVLATVAAFNMICSGTEVFSLAPVERPYDASYRIDLARGQWCEGGCDTACPIASVAGDRIVLRDGPPPRSATDRRAIRGGLWQTVEIDRASGALFDERTNGATAVVIRTTRRGQCRETDFTGLPDAAPEADSEI